MDFIVGHPRSGTKLIATMLNLAGDQIACHERLVTRVIGDWSSRTDFIDRATDYYLGACDAAAIRSFFEIYRLEPRFRIDSNWKLTWILPVLLAEYPDARFLHTVRDPRDNVRACYNLDYYGDRFANSDYFRNRPTLTSWYRSMPRVKRPDWDGLGKFERNCAFWAETHRLAVTSLAAQGSASYLRVRIEDLTDDVVLSSIFAFFDLPIPQRDDLQQFLKSTSANPKTEEKAEIDRQAIPQLKPSAEWSDLQRASFDRICGPDAVELGYPLALATQP